MSNPTKKEKEENTVDVNVPLLTQINGKLHSIIIGEEVEEVPTLHYIVGSNGIFQREFSPVTECIKEVTTKALCKLDAIEEIQDYKFPVISYSIYRTSLEFLRQVYKEHKAEGNVLLYLNLQSETPLDEQEYKMYIPKQVVTGSHVDYEMEDDAPSFEDGWFIAGTIHSHPGFGAFQSGTDHSDEINCDGIHYTLGHIDRTVPEIHGRVCIAGESFNIDEKDGSMIDTMPYEQIEIPESWMKKVSKKTYPVTTYRNSTGFHGAEQRAGKKTTHNTGAVALGASICKTIWSIIRPKNTTVQKSAKTVQLKEETCKILS